MGLVAAYVDHENSDPVIGTWIELSRSKINRHLRTMGMTCKSYSIGTGEKTEFTLPEDWGGARQILVGGVPATFLVPETFALVESGTAVLDGDTDYVYSIQNSKILFYPAPPAPNDGQPNITLLYYAQYQQMTLPTDTNDLLTHYPDVWLYLSVSEGHSFVMDEARSKFFSDKGYAALDSIQQSDWDDRWSGAHLDMVDS